MRWLWWKHPSPLVTLWVPSHWICFFVVLYWLHIGCLVPNACCHFVEKRWEIFGLSSWLSTDFRFLESTRWNQSYKWEIIGAKYLLSFPFEWLLSWSPKQYIWRSLILIPILVPHTHLPDTPKICFPTNPYYNPKFKLNRVLLDARAGI